VASALTNAENSTWCPSFAIAAAVVASNAGDDEVVDRVGAALAARHDMFEGRATVVGAVFIHALAAMAATKVLRFAQTFGRDASCGSARNRH